LGKLTAGGVDRRQNILRRRIDVAIEIELDGDRNSRSSCPICAGGGSSLISARAAPKRRQAG
jgi:hypothetical protein